MPLNLNDLNEFLTCKLCNGYLINATVLNDCCFDTFCKSCIINHLEQDNKCPKCKQKLTTDDLPSKLMFDFKKQRLVYKIVPNLYLKEKERRTLFYKEYPEDKINNELNHFRQGNNIWSLNDLIDISLEYLPLASINNLSLNTSNAKRRYLRVESGMKVSHLKKWIQNKFDLSFNQKVILLVNTEVLVDSLKMIDLAYIFSEEKYPLNLYFYYYKTPIDMKRKALKTKLNKKLKIKKKMKKINGNLSCILNSSGRNGCNGDKLQNGSNVTKLNKKNRVVIKRQIVNQGKLNNKVNGLNEVSDDSNGMIKNRPQLSTNQPRDTSDSTLLIKPTRQTENNQTKLNAIIKSPKAKRAKLENLNGSNSLNNLKAKQQVSV